MDCRNRETIGGINKLLRYQKEDKTMNSIINVMGIDINHISYQAFKKTTLEYLKNDGLNSYVFLSTKLIEAAAENEELSANLKEVDLLLPGEDQVYGGIKLPFARKNMVMGYHALLELASKMDKVYTVYFLAESDTDITKITNFTRINFPRLRVVGTYVRQDEWTAEQLVNAINSANPDMVINTCSIPMESRWVVSYLQQISAKLYIGLGAIFPTMVSELKEPPILIRKLHLIALYHKIRGYHKHRSLRIRIFKRKVEQYNTKKGDKEDGTTY